MGNLGDSAGKFFACLVVTHANILASMRSTRPRGRRFTAAWNALLPRTKTEVFAHPPLRYVVSPRYIFGAQMRRPVSCYAFFKGLLLLSKPPGCLRTRTSFTTELRFGDLSEWSGLFPSRRWQFAVTVSLPFSLRRVFGVCQDLVGRDDPRIQTVALPPALQNEAAPKGISKRTSYLRVR